MAHILKLDSISACDSLLNRTPNPKYGLKFRPRAVLFLAGFWSLTFLNFWHILKNYLNFRSLRLQNDAPGIKIMKLKCGPFRTAL